MIIGTGIDIIKIDRFRNPNARFLQRVFSVSEQAYLSTKGPESMAGLFAAKEAVAKALGTGFAGFFPCEIEILHNKNRKPYVKLHGKAKDILRHLLIKKATPRTLRMRRRCFTVHISISHSSTDAIAFAVLEAQNCVCAFRGS